MIFLTTLSQAVLSALPFVLLVGALIVGLFLRFFPFLHPLRVLRRLFCKTEGGNGSRGKDSRAPSPFRAASVALAGTIGVGNIAGVSLSLLVGGAGAIFWMWLCGCAAMILKYAEVTLCHSLRREGKGGTPDALRTLGLPRIGALFAVLCLVYSFTVGGMVQANAIAECMADAFSLSPLACGVILLLITLPAVLGGGRRISAITVRLVPAMCVLYVGATLAVIIAHAARLPLVLSMILREAFQPAAAGGGALSFLFSRALRTGMARGLMSNEGGCGTATLAHTESAEVDPARQGLFGILEVAIDTLFICTLTALAILCVFPALPEGVGAVALVRLSLSSIFGRFAAPLLSLTLFFFAYATILSAAFYSQK